MILVNFLTILISVILSFLIIVFILIMIIKNSLSNKSKKNVVKNPKTVLIAIDDVIYDNIENPFSKKLNFYNLNEKLNDVLHNEKIEKIIIDVDKTNLTNTQIEELEPIFTKLRQTKEVVAIGSLLDNNKYLMSMLASKIYLVKTANSTLVLRGYSKKLNYYKSLFDKIGIKFNVLHVGNHKSYGENFNHDNMSNELKEDITRLSNLNLEYFIEKVKKYRNVDITNDLIDGELFLNNSYDSLIDGYDTKSSLIDEDDYLINIEDYKIKNKKKNKSKNIIAVINLEGQINPGSTNNLSISYDDVLEKIELLENSDDFISGVVLNINSPGGSAYESSIIHSLLKERIDVPIFVSMKDVCASGGYFISTVARKIFVNETTLTGSIGVVALYPSFEKLIEKIGINIDGVEKGETVDFGNLTTSPSEKTLKILNKSLEATYKEFKACVIRGRLMTDKRLEPIAGGRVWTGKEAVENGLADKIGNLEDTIKSLANYLKFEDYKVINVEKKVNIKEKIKKLKPSMFFANFNNYYEPLMLYIKNEL
ncbi:S49 family peptidase [Caviibacter abscessus]|uniref:S49 family peptidase n=1 Tax=Caviibacter abscessus TaxID=1766719 RepID=UPI000832011F|nr:S49 family peptidase [Caviibacter abscessus]